jgi:hypothetical protein
MTDSWLMMNLKVQWADGAIKPPGTTVLPPVDVGAMGIDGNLDVIASPHGGISCHASISPIMAPAALGTSANMNICRDLLDLRTLAIVDPLTVLEEIGLASIESMAIFPGMEKAKVTAADAVSGRRMEVEDPTTLIRNMTRPTTEGLTRVEMSGGLVAEPTMYGLPRLALDEARVKTMDIPGEMKFQRPGVVRETGPVQAWIMPVGVTIKIRVLPL